MIEFQPFVDEIVIGFCGERTNKDTAEAIMYTYGDGELVIKGTGTMRHYACNPLEARSPFAAIPDLKRVVIAHGVKNIGASAFAFNDTLEEIIMSDTVEVIGTEAFYGCKSLHSIKFSSNLKEISDRAFYGCANLRNIHIPESVYRIDLKVFHNTAWYNCQKTGLLYLGSVLYDNKGYAYEDIQSVDVGEGTTVIAGGIFERVKTLKTLNIPDTVKGIGAECFRSCTNLSTVTLPNNMCYIGHHAFCNTGIKTIQIPKSLKELTSWVFGACEKLENIDIPDGLEQIAMESLYKCPALKEIVIPESVKNIGANALGYYTFTERIPLIITGGKQAKQYAVCNDLVYKQIS